MADYSNLARQRTTSPLMAVVSVTPSDSTDLPNGVCRAIYSGTTANVEIVDQYGNDVTMNSLQAGIWHPVQAKRIKAAGTTAINILAGY